MAFYNTTDCRLYLEEICKTFKLCPKYCHLQESVDHCSHFRIDQCEGICRGDETPGTYNLKVKEAINYMQSGKDNFIIKEKGRNSLEEAIVLIQDGKYAGYGFISKNADIHSFWCGREN